MLNDCKYGVNVVGSEIRLTLLKAPLMPDMCADRGMQEFTYAFYPFEGPFRESNVVREAAELNEPTVFAPAGTVRRPILVPAQKNIVVDTIKPADTAERALLIRAYEAMGMDTEASFAVGGGIAKIEETDILEEIPRELCRGETLRVPFGAFYTPNHRWAIASVLAACGKIYGEDDLTRAAFAYLKEGIDCNGDGEYSEKSAGNYNGVNNDAMLLLAEALGDPSYEQHVIRNLRMMLTYWEPDDSIFTANSTRFDKDRLVYPDSYYWSCLALGVRYNIPEFLAMANYIFKIVEEKRILSPDCLMQYMLHPELIGAESNECGTPERYRAFYARSGIARVRRGRPGGWRWPSTASTGSPTST